MQAEQAAPGAGAELAPARAGAGTGNADPLLPWARVHLLCRGCLGQTKNSRKNSSSKHAINIFCVV